MRLLCLDLGTRTGWAILDRGGAVSSGVYDLSSFRKQGAGMRSLRLRQWLVRYHTGAAPDQATRLDAIYFEEVRRHSSVQAAHVYGELSGALMAFCEEYAIPYSSVPVGTIKKAATGKGNASKQEMIAAAIHHYGIFAMTDDEADALGILRYAQTVLHPELAGV